MELGLSPEEFRSLSWYDWGLYCLKLHRNRKEYENRIELYKEFVGQMCATVANFAGKSLPKGKQVEPKHFFKFANDDTQAEEDVIQELLRNPKLKKFKSRNGK